MVSQKLESRFGTEAEFLDMVRRCNAVKVGVVVDVVFNHVASGAGTGHNGSMYNAATYNYPGLSPTDFHRCVVSTCHNPVQCTT